MPTTPNTDSNTDATTDTDVTDAVVISEDADTDTDTNTDAALAESGATDAGAVDAGASESALPATASDLWGDVVAKATKGLAPTTRRIYAGHVRTFRDWCQTDAAPEGASILPAAPDVVEQYLTQKMEDRSVSWMRQSVAALDRLHKRTGHPAPSNNAAVEAAVQDLAREHGTPARKKTPMRTADVKAAVDAIEVPRPEGEPSISWAWGRYFRFLRDRAILLVGYTGAFRRSELAQIRMEHLDFSLEGVEVLIPRSKGDQSGSGQIVAINRLNGPYCPVKALLTWIEAAGIEAGPIFRRVRQRGGIAPDAEATPLSGRSVRRTIAGAADAADLNGDFAGHSLRRGHLTEAALRGASLVDMQRQARHADPATTTQYIDDAQRMQRSTSSNLGL